MGLSLLQLHEVGGMRNIRYRDLMSNVVGKWSYYPVRLKPTNDASKPPKNAGKRSSSNHSYRLCIWIT